MKKLIRETVGCDLGDRTSELCVVGVDGEQRRLKPVATTAVGFRKTFGKRRPTHVVIEVGAHSRWVAPLLTELGHRVTVANPRRVKLISQSRSKTDRHDAALLARLGRADVELLSPITHRGIEAQADLAVIKARDTLVKTRTRLVSTIRGTVKSFGERLPSCAAEAFHRKTKDQIPAFLRPAVGPLYGALGALEVQIKALEKQINALGEKYPDTKVVSQIDSVGTLTALTFLLTLEDKNRFKVSRDVGAFVGLTPRRDQSGDMDKQLGITKAGDELLRRLLVQCANRILGPFGKDCDLRRWGLKLASHGGKNARKRAKVAVARKLSVLMHRLWVTGEVYEELRQAEKLVA